MKEKRSDSLFFSNRHPFEVSVQTNEGNIKDARQNYLKLTNSNILRMKKIPNRPKAMDYFDRCSLNKEFRLDELRKKKEQGKKIVGIFCIQVPEELIYAADAIPIRLCSGFYDAISPAEEIVPKNICSLIKSDVGFNFLRINPLFEICDVIIIPTTCDGRKKMSDILSNYYKIWTMDVPNDKDNAASRNFWEKQISELKEKLEKLTGNQITKKSLASSIKLLHRRTELSRALMEIRQSEKIIVTGRDIYLVMQVAFFDEINRWMHNVMILMKEMEENIKNNITMMPSSTVRVMMTGSPLVWPNMKLLHIIEESGAVVITDDSCSCGQYFYNPVELDEWSMKAMLDAVADKALLPITCPIFIHSDDRIDRMLELVKQYKCDGVIYHLLRLCQVFDFEYTKVNKALEKNNIPLLRIETELSEEDAGQLKTRVEAFIEMLEARK
jgi:benzoyl-CoA reductase/2-hydroxyglutaryl-CoA dehydratase subunit BcrC/BadD/HgdB